MFRRTRLISGLLLASMTAVAQQYVISTYAGGAPLPTPAPAVEVAIEAASGVATDATGNIYFANADSIFKVDPSGVLTRVAGNSKPGYSGDGGPATSARLQLRVCCLPGPAAVAVDSTGNLFIADTGNNRIRKVFPSGIIATVAGNGTPGFSGNGGPATSAQLNWPLGVAVDGAGNLFIADRGNNHIRKVSTSGIITSVAGGGTLQGSSGDGGPATSAALETAGVAVDGAGNLFLVDGNSYDGRARIRKVSPSGIITTVAGTGTAGFSGDDGPATNAQLILTESTGLAVDGAGNLFLADRGNLRIRQVSLNGIITTVAGNGTLGLSGDGGPATSAQLYPLSVAVDGAGNLFVADGNLYISRGGNRIRKVSPGGIITTVAGCGCFAGGNSGDGGPATNARLSLGGGDPNSLGGTAVDSAGNLFIADTGNHRIRKVSPSGIMTTVAGNGTRGSSGDGGPATSAQLSQPLAVAVDGGGNLFIADTGNNRIRKVSPSGIITTHGVALHPTGVAVDGAGNLFFTDSPTISTAIRKMSPSGIITTVAGGGSLRGPLTDGAPATDANLFGFLSMAVDGAGNLFIGAPFDGRVHKVSPSGIINTVAGGGSYGFSGDGGPATSADLRSPFGVAVDRAGNLFIATSDIDWDISGGAERIRKVSPDGIITTVAGDGTFAVGFSRGWWQMPPVSMSSDGGPAISAQLAGPTGVAVDGAGNVYFVDSGNNAVRILRPTNRSVLISALVDAASQRADPVSPGKIVVLYGAGLGPSQLIQNQPSNGVLGTALGATAVFFNGIAARIVYTSATQVAAVVPYAVSGTTAPVTATYQGQVSDAFTVPVAASAPSIFTLNQTGAGQAAAINAVDGTVNTAANPVRIGGFVSLYATGEGQTEPTTPPRPVLPVRVTVGGVPATVQYAGSTPDQVAGLMQVNVQIPSSVQPGGYVPVVLQVGDRSSSPAVWIAVAN